MTVNPWDMDWSGVKIETAQSQKPTSGDIAELREASRAAQTERDASRTYTETERAIKNFSTGPLKGWFFDAITPEPEGGILDSVGGIVGAPVRALIPQNQLDAFDHLRTVSADVAIDSSQDMKGASSDRDMALQRMRGVSPYKTSAENMRIIEAARRSSGIAQTRAAFKSRWISQYGSIANAAPNGMTFEQGLKKAERLYEQYRKEGVPKNRPGLPKPPPRGQSSSKEVIYDINGNPIE